MTIFKRPMLAASLLDENVEHTDEEILKALQKLRYPVLASLKLDGIRALRMNGTLLSRTLKPIPNKSIRERSIVLPGGFDVELWAPNMDYNTIQSIVMSKEHERQNEIKFHVLDWFGIAEEYKDRIRKVQSWILESKVRIYYPVIPLCETPNQLMGLFLQYEQLQGEGICFRIPNSPYKQGRSTLKEQYLVKLCRYSRTEVTIIGFEEQLENGNSTKRNALGLMDRSSHQSDMCGKDTLGAFKVRDKIGREYTVGTGVGLTDKLRKKIWEDRDVYYGKEITIKYKGYGEKDKPRSPIFIGFRTKGT